ncbi:MAG: aminopeptidase P family protein [Bacteroidetes bacterium]|nr:MAG: aminopeptidase P family protein [Bacteroidota bacterium]
MFHKDIYVQRRNKLTKLVNNGIVLLLGNTDVPMNYASNVYHWRQDSTFLYFFGLDYQNMAAVIDTDNGTEHLFGNDVSLDDIIWMGPQISTAEKAQACGVSSHHPYSKLQDVVAGALKSGRKVHFLPPYRAENKILLESLTGIKPAQQKEKASTELIKAVVALRSVKDEFEIAELEKGMDTAWLMHTTAMKMARPGVYEREIAGAIEGIALAAGGMLSFPAIVSRRGETLHNHYHGNKLEKNDLLLVDTGAETSLHYATDHSRTTPVGGKFTPKQKDIYQAVLEAQVLSIESMKPGATNLSAHLLAAETLANRLKDLGLMKGDISSAVQQGAHALFMPHGLGHMMGLDVHDMEDLGENYVGYDDEVKRSDIFGTAFLRLGRKYQPGFVLTVEPGCYFIPALIDQWQGEGKFREYINYDKVNEYRDFGGIRIEDDILITDTGYKMLGKPIPKTVEEVEEIAGKD